MEYEYVGIILILQTLLLLEPNEHPAAKEYQKKLFADGIPVTMFGVEDIHKEYNRLMEKGVRFTMEPTEMYIINQVDKQESVE